MNSTLESLSSDKENPDLVKSKAPLFFNYHEFSVTRYFDLETQLMSDHPQDLALCITHFPNVYTAMDSQQYFETRLVRIPRRFDVHVDVPSFSTQLPGQEPAALVGSHGGDRFVPRGVYQNQAFGLWSVSPLSNYMTSAEFREVVDTVNNYLLRAYSTDSWWNLASAILDTLTFHMWNSIAIRVFRSPLQDLENYVETLNESASFKEKKLRLISPRRSGYLSVCCLRVFPACRSNLIGPSAKNL
ncbi:LADA_0E00650g1_1 [Lachancea dasiensis]|uniref:Ras modification protein ERF4 n=1 Tax=Lachancea dasiensis TaxID=1072105 RepID=A0A1G4JAM5_9SACH|nr:LADA_0E00650g1_1 [Lachancea dasiensis]